jgi:hypothetical protein
MRPILKSTKVSAKKPAAAKAKTSNSPSAGKGLPRKARKPASLPKSDGDAGVQAYIASMEPWQAAIAKRVDALVVKHVPGVRKAVRWHCPFYGVEGQGWFLAFSGFQHHVKFSFFKGTSLKPVPPIGQFKDVRSLDVRESDKIDEKQLATWIKQFKLTESGLVVEMPQIDVSFSAGVEKLRRLNESFEGILEESGSFRRRT